MKSRTNGKERIRYNIVIVLIYIMGAILLMQLFNLQIIHGKDYRETSNTRLTRQTKIKASRGNVLDCKENKLITNEMGFSLDLYKTKIDNQTLNKTILEVINLLEKNEDKCVDNLPIKINPYEFTYKTEESQKKWKKECSIPESASAQEAFEFLKNKYDIQEEKIENTRKIMTIRYEIDKNGFGSIRPVKIAKNISNISAVQLEEQKDSFPGVSLVAEPIIVYPYGKLASHVLGYVGAISPEEYKANKDKYDINDEIGITGIQYTLEEYLRGEDGTKQIDMAVDGTITDEYISKQAIAGDNVILTIDANLQKIVEDVLEKNIEDIKNGKYGKKYNVKSGTTIVMDVETGDVLALANYPDYEPELFIKGISTKKIEEYNKGGNLYNRAISGIYAPGSTFKMVSATAGLEENVITPETKINDIGKYPKGHHPACWFYTKHHYGHGYLNVSEAIQKSCNYFFYELGDRLGIDKIAKYAEKYGLGKRTGIELAGEEKGIVASREYKKETYGQEWEYGETLSAVIGQSYNSFTPIQMARYISMIANGGNPVEVSLIKKVVNQEGKIVPKEEIEKNVNKKLGINDTNKVEKLNLKESTLQSILKGMKGVTSEPGGTAYYIFKDLGMDIGGKTGSAETGRNGEVNGWFVGFAPYDKPKIAIVTLIENAGSRFKRCTSSERNYLKIYENK